MAKSDGVSFSSFLANVIDPVDLAANDDQGLITSSLLSLSLLDPWKGKKKNFKNFNQPSCFFFFFLPSEWYIVCSSNRWKKISELIPLSFLLSSIEIHHLTVMQQPLNYPMQHIAPFPLPSARLVKSSLARAD